MDVFQVANAFVSHVQKGYAQEVALVAYYGSYAIGKATDGSDLDMYYIPEDGKAKGLYRSFIVDGIPFEFWPVSWAFAEKIASGKHRWSVAPSILVNARVLYARSEADLARYEALKTQIVDIQKPENKSIALARAWEAFQAAPFYLEMLRYAGTKQDVVGTRWMGCQLVGAVLDCLTLVNQTFFARDWTSELESMQQLRCKPTQLVALIETITTAREPLRIQGAAEELLRATREIVVSEQSANYQTVTMSELLDGYYTAICEYASKIYSACKRENLVKASYWAAKLQTELAFLLAQSSAQVGESDMNLYSEYGSTLTSLGWPDLVEAIATRDFDYIARQVQEFIAQARAYLIAHSVALNEYKTLEAAQAYIQGQGK
jgi:predicted nucleotidyltransferase